MLWRGVVLGVLAALFCLLFILVPGWSFALAQHYEQMNIKEAPWPSEVLLRVGPGLRVPLWVPIVVFAGIVWPTLRGRLDQFMRMIIPVTLLIFVVSSLWMIVALRPLYRVGEQRIRWDNADCFRHSHPRYYRFEVGTTWKYALREEGRVREVQMRVVGIERDGARILELEERTFRLNEVEGFLVWNEEGPVRILSMAGYERQWTAGPGVSAVGSYCERADTPFGAIWCTRVTLVFAEHKRSLFISQDHGPVRWTEPGREYSLVEFKRGE